MLKLVKEGQEWTRTYVAHKDLTVCAVCGEVNSLRKGDYWDCPDDTKLRCQECGRMYTVGELLQ